MAVTAELVEQIKKQIGDTSEPVSVTIDALTSRRYARAVGVTDPVYLDDESARAAGYDGLLVPPNFLPSYLDWSDGGPEDSLRIDGTPRDELAWVPTEGVRLMGGGEEMIFHAPVLAGTEVVLTSTLEDVTSRESKSGLMFIITIRNTYATTDGTPLITARRTVLGR